MPRVLAKEQLRVEAAVSQYVAPIYADPINDLRPTSLSAVAKALRISRDTLRRHRADLLLRSAAEYRDRIVGRRGSLTYSKLRARIVDLESELAKVNRMYSELLEMRMKIEWALRVRGDIDLDAIIDAALPSPERGLSVRKGKKRKRQFF